MCWVIKTQIHFWPQQKNCHQKLTSNQIFESLSKSTHKLCMPLVHGSITDRCRYGEKRKVLLINLTGPTWPVKNFFWIATLFYYYSVQVKDRYEARSLVNVMKNDIILGEHKKLAFHIYLCYSNVWCHNSNSTLYHQFNNTNLRVGPGLTAASWDSW